MKTVATIEARMTSTRLPGKVMMEANGKSLLKHLVDRLKTVTSLDGICLATTVNPEDDILADFAREEDVSCFG